MLRPRGVIDLARRPGIVRGHAGNRDPCGQALNTIPSPDGSDETARQTAIQIEQDFPRWMVMWGVHSQEYWAFARFEVPQGVILHAADPNELARQMRDIELRAAGRLP
jgi:hypothetical protein